MPISHALISAVTCTDEQVPGLLDVLAQVTDPRRRRGRFTLVFVLAVAVTCALARGEESPGDRRPGRRPAAGAQRE
jgi:hypothetical protein